METEKKLTREWDVSAYDHKKGEWTTAVNRSYEYSKATYPVEPVVPARITPDRRKPLSRDYKTIFVFSDAQIGYRRIDGELVPLHDEPSIFAAQALARNLRPDVMVDCGDPADLSEVGRHPIDSDHFQGTLQPTLQRTHDMYAQFTSVSPGAVRFAVDSNHVKRLNDYMLKNAFPLAGIKTVGEKYPAISFPGLLKLDEIGWNYIGGYGSAEYEYADDLAFTHGRFAVSGGSTAAKLARANYGRNIVQGHKHSIESHYQTDRKGNQFGAFVVGALCRIDGVVPSYHSSIDQNNQPVKRYENWQNGVMVIRDYGDSHYEFNQVPIKNGVIKFEGKVYGNE